MSFTLNSNNKLVLFIKHGESTLSNNNIVLSELGEEQANRTAEFITNKLSSNEFESINVFTSPEYISVNSSLPLIEKLNESNIKFNYRILQNSYEYRRPNKGDSVFEIKKRKYPVKVDKTWPNFIKRVDSIKKMLEMELVKNNKSLIILYGHSVFFSSLFSNFVVKGESYPKHYKQIIIQLPNSAISCAGFDANTKHWDIFYIGAVNHTDQITSGNHTDFNLN